MRNSKPISALFFLLFLCLQQLIAQNPVTVVLCASGSAASSTASAGTVFDSGGPQGIYNNGEYCSLLINPGCATSLTLTVADYVTENCCDYLLIFDGENESAPLLANMQNINAPATFTSSSGKLFLVWRSDGSVTYGGFQAVWTSTLVAQETPVASITVSDETPALLEPVSFSADATNYPFSWEWAFGDGSSSNQQNPTHTYAAPGTYEAVLTVTNCHGLKDTVAQTLTMQAAPHVTISPASFQISTLCSDTAKATVIVTNDGQGDLLYNARGEADYGRRKVLIYTYSVNGYSLLGIQGLLDLHPNAYSVSLTSASDAAGLSADLVDKDVLIIPEFPQNIDVWFLMNQNSAFQTFLEDGGSIIVCGSSNYNFFFSATGYVSAPDFYTNDVSGSTLSFPLIHAITQNMPASYVAPYFAGTMGFNDPQYESLCDFNGRSVVGYKKVNAGNVVYLGFNFQTVDTPLENLMLDALHWSSTQSSIVLSATSGKLAAGESMALEATIVTEKVLPGDYTGAIKVLTNNPDQVEVTVPFDLLVSGQAVLQPNQSTVVFDTILQFATQKRTIIIDNPGCDSLHISAFSADVASFSSSVSELHIPPFSSDTFSISFSPADTGIVNGVITLTSNVDPVKINVSGFALGAPSVIVTPDSLFVTMGCGETAESILTFRNKGLGDLHLSTSQAGVAGSDNLKILIFNELYYYYYIPANVESWIVTAYPNAEIIHFDNSKPISSLPALLAQSNMAILPAIGGGNLQLYPEVGQHLIDYMNNGGSVLMTGTPYPYQLNALGITTVDVNYRNLYSNSMILLEPEHPIFEDYPVDYINYDDVFTYNFTSPNFVTLSRSTNDLSNYTTVGYEKIGAGTFIYMGHECEATYPPVVEMLKNAINWAATPRWVAASEAQLTISPGDSVETSIHLTTERLKAGQYQYNLLWTSDDPANPTVSVPLILTVQGAPVLESNVSNLNFGVLQQFAQKNIPVPISNTGCDTLHILQASSSNPAFTIEQGSGQILPFSEGKLTLNFSPQTPGAHNGVITVETDGGTLTISVLGLAVSAPIAGLNPGSIQVTLSCDGTQSIPLTLNNTGQGNLNYDIGGVNSPHKIAFFTYGASYYRLNNIRGQIQANISNLQLMELGSISASAMADSLKKVETLVIPTLDISTDATILSYAPVIQDFLNDGGQVFVIGMNAYDPILQMGLLSVSSVEGHSYEPVQVVNPAHPVVQELPRTFNTDDYCIGLVLQTSSKIKPIINFSSNAVYLGIQNQGSGNIVYWGHQFDNTLNEDGRLLLVNLFNWAHNPVPGGIAVPLSSGNVAAGSSKTIEVQFNGAGLVGGVYTGQIRIYSNDPQQNPLIVPVELTMSSAPCAAFGFEIPACSPSVRFLDSTINNLSSWYWQFGDGAEGFTQNPSHIYTSGGDYTVTLVGCNNFGCDTTSRIVRIDGFDGPVLSNCNPNSINYCCEVGIKKVTIGMLDHESGNASEGYQDFSCTYGTEIMAGEQIPITITTGNQNNEYVRVWIDFNNNGIFTANEQVYTDYNFGVHEGFITIPNSAIKNVRLRMRVASELNAAPLSCGDLQYGQAEDYYVISKTFVGTTEPRAGFSIKLFPNPSSGDTWMELNLLESEGYNYDICDIAGRVLHTAVVKGADAQNKVKLPQLAAGTYTVKVQAGGENSVQKLMVVDRL